MSAEMWTAESVRRHLPTVPVRDGKRTIAGIVRRKLGGFAVVRDPADDARTWEFSWETLAAALNAGRLGSVAPARIEVPRRVHPHEWKVEALAAWYRERGWHFPGRCPDCSAGYLSNLPAKG
jgi:hypothetical protein